MRALLVLLAGCCLLNMACGHTGAASSPNVVDSGVQDCGAGLSESEIMEVVNMALEAEWGDTSLDGMSSHIYEDGCDYLFSAQHPGEAPIEGISILIDRAGRVKSFPTCCYVGHCPDLCEAPDRSS